MEKISTPAMPRRRLTADMAVVYERWEEVKVLGERGGKREFRYFLKRSDGVSDLAVVGKEREKERDEEKKKRVSYRFTSRIKKLFFDVNVVDKKLKSRRDVVAWLDKVVSGSQTHSLPRSDDYLLDGTSGFKGTRLSHPTREFAWLGSPWMCRKRRRHYKSYCRDGVQISVHDFVFVLSEEKKRLVAYLEDMYEDMKGNKMVEARWFHRIDEVCSVLHHSFNDNEVFFSPSLQDISVECIDGLSTVLSPQHYDRYMIDASHIKLEPFVCRSEFVNDKTKPFDITHVEGYWNQEIIRYMHAISPFGLLWTCQPSDDGLDGVGDLDGDANDVLPRKRLRRLNDDSASFPYIKKKDSTTTQCLNKLIESNSGAGPCGSETCDGRGHCSAGLSSKKEARQISPPTKCLVVGSQVEVLSQDSGLRGCWFKAVIIKKYRDKVKVCYEDVQDADDEAKKLEEWLLESRVAVPDKFGFRITGRTTIRPARLISGSTSRAVDIGAVVDVWWYGGWWEGIVTQKESESRIHVYFPGENKKSIFCTSDMRHSQEWLGNSWIDITGKPDLVSLLLSGSVSKRVDLKSGLGGQTEGTDYNSPEVCGYGSNSRLHGWDPLKSKENVVGIPDLLEGILPQWKTSRKRRSVNGRSIQEMHDADKCNGTKLGVGPRKFLVRKSLKVDRDNCKLVGDAVFGSPSVRPLTNLVMSS